MSWVKFTQENIARSRGEREISAKLRADIEICLRQCANDMVSQFQFINNALKARIQENTDVKHKLEMHLQQVGLSPIEITNKLKPRPHQQQCRSNIVECYKSNDSYDKVECGFDIVSVFSNNFERNFVLLTKSNTN